MFHKPYGLFFKLIPPLLDNFHTWKVSHFISIQNYGRLKNNILNEIKFECPLFQCDVFDKIVYTKQRQCSFIYYIKDRKTCPLMGLHKERERR